jgi:hypothetical protein
MGLDVSFYSEVTVLGDDHEPSEDCWDDHSRIYVLEGFEHALGSLVQDRCYDATTERTDHIHHSYGGYNVFREALCLGILKVEPKEVWDDPQTYVDRPFYHQINFSDNEGVMGPEAAAKLAKDYADHREDFFVYLTTDYPHTAWIDSHQMAYDHWAKALATVGPNGLVDFH